MRTRSSTLEVAHYTEGHLSKAGYLKARDKLVHRIESNRQALSRQEGSGILLALPSNGTALRAIWEAEGIAWRRRVLAAVLESVVLKPAVVGRNFFDPDRLEFGWRS